MTLEPLRHYDTKSKEYMPDPDESKKKVLQSRKWSLDHYWRHRERINMERRDKHASICDCGTIFRGSGCWQQIKRHKEIGHNVCQGNKDVLRVGSRRRA